MARLGQIVLFSVALLVVTSAVYYFYFLRTQQAKGDDGHVEFKTNKVGALASKLHHISKRVASLIVPPLSITTMPESDQTTVHLFKRDFPLVECKASIALYNPDQELFSIHLVKQDVLYTNVRNIFNWFLKDATPGQLVVDVPGVVGFLMAFAVCAGHRVVVFEPYKTNMLKISQTVFLNQWMDRVTLVQAQPWGSFGTTQGYGGWLEKPSLLNTGMATLASRHLVSQRISGGQDRSVEKYTAHKVLMDSYISEPVYFMKLDSEGCDCHGLMGAKSLFGKHGVRYVFIQMEPESYQACDCNPGDVVAFFTHFGYEFFDLNGFTVPSGTVPGKLTRRGYAEEFLLKKVGDTWPKSFKA